MRLTIIYILLLAAAGTILYFTEDYEVREEKREAEELLAWQQKQDSIAKAEEAIYQNHIKPYLDNPYQDTIDLSGLGLKKLPEDLLSKMMNFTYLDLSDNNFRKLPEGVFNHGKLEILNLSYNKITALDNIYIHENLKKLTLKNTGLIQYPDLNYFPNLEYLDLSHNTMNHYLHFENVECLNLTYIDISHNGFVGIRGIDNFPNLQVVIANNNLMYGIPKFLYNEKLRYLDLSDNNIRFFNFPEYSEILLELKTIKINNNNLKSIRENVAIKNLQHLEVQNNSLTNINNITTYYPNLTYLDVRENSFEVMDSIRIMKIDSLTID